MVHVPPCLYRFIPGTTVLCRLRVEKLRIRTIFTSNRYTSIYDQCSTIGLESKICDRCSCLPSSGTKRISSLHRLWWQRAQRVKLMIYSGLLQMICERSLQVRSLNKLRTLVRARLYHLVTVWLRLWFKSIAYPTPQGSLGHGGPSRRHDQIQSRSFFTSCQFFLSNRSLHTLSTILDHRNHNWLVILSNKLTW